MDVRVGLWRKLSTEKLMLFNYGVGKDSWESFGLQGDPTSSSWRRSVLGVHWKDWCWSWNSNTLATSCKELTHWKRPWCWDRLGAGEGDSRGWDGWMASLTPWAWVWVNSRSLWWTGRPGVLQFMGLQRVGHDWATELNWTEHIHCIIVYCCYSVAKSCPTLWDPMGCAISGFPIFHYILGCAQTHIHWVSDAIQPSHLLLTSSPAPWTVA